MLQKMCTGLTILISSSINDVSTSTPYVSLLNVFVLCIKCANTHTNAYCYVVVTFILWHAGIVDMFLHLNMTTERPTVMKLGSISRTIGAHV